MNAVTLFEALASDLMAAKGWGLASTGSAVSGGLLNQLLRKRAERAREVLITELRHGRATLFDVDPEEAVSVVYRYFRAATEGAARLNLGLLGSCIANGTGRDSLRADEFLRWADALASLSREEIHLLACLRAVGDWSRQEATDWSPNSWMDRVANRMTAHFGYSHMETLAAFAALTRTGCVAFGPPRGGMTYTNTPVFHELMRLVDVEGAIVRHSGGRESP